jgi:hypothetical protein
MAVKSIAIATIVMSTPLMLSFNLKYQWLPQGILYFALFFSIALSFYAVPCLLAIGIILGLRLYFSETADHSLLKWSMWGTSVGLIAEIIYIAARFSPAPRTLN